MFDSNKLRDPITNKIKWSHIVKDNAGNDWKINFRELTARLVKGGEMYKDAWQTKAFPQEYSCNSIDNGKTLFWHKKYGWDHSPVLGVVPAEIEKYILRVF